jgi:Family of unknown function (DUF5947)
MNGPRTPFSALRRFVRPREVAERCELCSVELTAEHPHLVDLAVRQIVCACQPCSILFSGPANTKFRRIPGIVRSLSDFQITNENWDGLMIPIGMAFFYYSSTAGRTIAIYPSPAGATESLLDLDTWDTIVEANPALKDMEPDVEALLVNRVNGARTYYVVPIDECYRLVGLIRAHWRGFSGGTEAWNQIKQFFERLEQRAIKGQKASNA